MRSARLVVLAVLVLGACRTPPPPAPAAALPPPKPEGPAFAITGLSPTAQTLSKLTLDLTGEVRDDVTARTLKWTATIGDKEVGSGTETLAGAGAFDVSLPASFGKTLDDLQPYQASDTVTVVVHASLDDGGQEVSDQRALDIRSPLLPKVRIINVESSRPQSDVLDLTFLLGIHNPNPWDVRVGKLTYVAKLGDATLASTDLAIGQPVPGSSEERFELPVEANQTTCGKQLSAVLHAKELPWSFDGTLEVGGLTVPVSLSGSSPISPE